MIIQLHTPKGIIEIDSETATDEKLTELHLTRETLNGLISRDMANEVDKLTARVEQLEKVNVST